MDELVKYVAGKTGLSLDQARQAAQATIDYLKNRVPPQLAADMNLETPDEEGLPAGAKSVLGFLDKF